MPDKPSRRRFLSKGCLIAAGAGVAVCGAGAAAATYKPKVNLPITSCGQEPSAGRILIAYASKAGSTAEVAVRMGQTITQHDFVVDVQPVSTVNDIASYRAVVVGSAIRAGNLLPEAMSFIQKNQSGLAQKPFSIFVLCMTLETDNEETRKTVSAYLEPVRALIQPASEGLFAGVMNLSKLTLFEHLLVLAMRVPPGDFRQWPLINGWAQDLSSHI